MLSARKSTEKFAQLPFTEFQILTKSLLNVNLKYQNEDGKSWDTILSQIK